jgi:MFS family permease
MGRGGMQFMLIIWLQGIWLPLHGYSFSQTPLWAGIYLVPLTVGFLLAAPLSGVLSDKFGAKPFTVGGALLTGATFLMLIFVPVNFAYWEFAAVIALNGFGSGLFFSPNWAEMMNSVPPSQRGAAGGMIATFQNSAFVLSIGIFFTLMVAGLSSTLPRRASRLMRPRRSRTCPRSACCSPPSSATTRCSNCSGRCSRTCPPRTPRTWPGGNSSRT